MLTVSVPGGGECDLRNYPNCVCGTSIPTELGYMSVSADLIKRAKLLHWTGVGGSEGTWQQSSTLICNALLQVNHGQSKLVTRNCGRHTHPKPAVGMASACLLLLAEILPITRAAVKMASTGNGVKLLLPIVKKTAPRPPSLQEHISFIINSSKTLPVSSRVCAEVDPPH